MDKLTWETLRWKMKVSELKALAKKEGIPIDDIPEKVSQKKRIARRLWNILKGS